MHEPAGASLPLTCPQPRLLDGRSRPRGGGSSLQGPRFCFSLLGAASWFSFSSYVGQKMELLKEQSSDTPERGCSW